MTRTRVASRIFRLVLCGALAALTFGCDEGTSGPKPEKGSGLEAGSGLEGGAGLEAGPRPEAGAADLGRDGRAKDSGSCAQSGQSCLSKSCCGSLECCSGMPIPAGQAICYVTCPVSDRKLKHAARPLAPAEVLQRLARLPISSWTYNNEPPGVRHVGPMAQDFHAAFGLGPSDQSIAPVDADGVALVAIQALHAEVRALRCELGRLREENRSLAEQVGRLRGRRAAR